MYQARLLRRTRNRPPNSISHGLSGLDERAASGWPRLAAVATSSKAADTDPRTQGSVGLVSKSRALMTLVMTGAPKIPRATPLAANHKESSIT